MKTKILLLIFIFLSVGSSGLLAKDKDSDEKAKKTTLFESMNLEKQTIQNFKSYKFSLIWIDEKPLIQLTQENEDFTTHKVDLRNIVTVDPQQSILAQTKAMLALGDFKNFKADKVVQTESCKYNDEDDKDNLLLFNAYDSKNQLRMSQWRTIQNGFPAEEIIFGDTGKPLGLTYYFQPVFNAKNLSLDYSGKRYHFPLKYALDNFGPVDLDDAKDVIKFCKKLLEKALSNINSGK